MNIYDNLVSIHAYSYSDTCKPWLTKKRTCIKKIGWGMPILLGKDLYVFTCYHVVKNTYKLNILTSARQRRSKLYMYDTIDAEIVCVSQELELAILKLHKKIPGIRVKQLTKIMPKTTNRIYINSINFVTHREHLYKKKSTMYTCGVTNIIFDKLESLNMPELPIIKTNTSFVDISIKKLHGLSGMIVLNDSNEIVGIISTIECDSGDINIIPSISIIRLIKEYHKYNNFYGLCDIIALYNENILEFDNREYNSIIIQKTYGIHYGTTSTHKYNLKVNDVIYGIGNQYFNSNYMIYYSDIQNYVPISTYIALNYMKDDPIDFNIYRVDSAKSLQNITICAKSVTETKYLSNIMEHKYCSYNGFIFMELSEEYIELYNKIRGNMFYNYMIKYMIERPYRDDYKKVVVLIDINKNSIDNVRTVSKLDELNIPVVKLMEDECDMYQLIKINDMDVIDITSVQKCVRNSNINTFYLKYPTHNNNKIKIKFHNNTVRNVEYWDSIKCS